MIKNDVTHLIDTVARNGQRGYDGDGEPAVRASLNYPWGIVLDSTGNIYVADDYNNRIRKIETNGNIKTIVGNGHEDYSGDGGPATWAGLSTWDVAVDDTGNIYIADTVNNRIRKVTTEGIITTVAGNGQCGYGGNGGPAIESILDDPSSVAVDDAGNIYIADTVNNRIRKVTTEGIITTVAGNGQCWYGEDGGPAIESILDDPSSVAVDDAGNIYITEFWYSRVRKVDNSGIITTIAGNGKRGFSGDGGPAVQAKLNGPQGIAIDSFGNIYINDSNNNRIRKVTTDGVITTVAGNGRSGYSGDGGPATLAGIDPWDVAADNIGNIYIADGSNKRIRKVTTDGVITTVAWNGRSGYSGDGRPATTTLLPSTLSHWSLKGLEYLL